MCNTTMQPSVTSLSVSHPPNCLPSHRSAPTVVWDAEHPRAMGLTNQLMFASHALEEACRSRRNFAGYWRASSFGGSKLAASNDSGLRDLSELFHLSTFRQRLHKSADAVRRTYVACNSSGMLSLQRIDCSATELVPVACLGEHDRRRKEHAWSMTPFRPRFVLALMPMVHVPWSPTLCGFSFATHAFNAVHFNIDVDWLLFICTDLAIYGRGIAGLLSIEEEIELLSRRGRLAPFVRRVVIPQFIRAMNLTFEDSSLPVVACTSLGKLFAATRWIADEFETAVHKTFGARLVLGSAGSSARELNAIADLQALARARSAVLWPGSSFSELAAAHRATRNASTGWVANLAVDGLCELNRTEVTWQTSLPGVSRSLYLAERHVQLWPKTGRAAASQLCKPFNH